MGQNYDPLTGLTLLKYMVIHIWVCSTTLLVDTMSSSSNYHTYTRFSDRHILIKNGVVRIYCVYTLCIHIYSLYSYITYCIHFFMLCRIGFAKIDMYFCYIYNWSHKVNRLTTNSFWFTYIQATATSYTYSFTQQGAPGIHRAPSIAPLFWCTLLHYGFSLIWYVDSRSDNDARRSF